MLQYCSMAWTLLGCRSKVGCMGMISRGCSSPGAGTRSGPAASHTRTESWQAVADIKALMQGVLYTLFWSCQGSLRHSARRRPLVRASAFTPAEPLELFIKTLATILNGFSNKVNSCDIGRFSFGVCTNLVRTVAFRNIYCNFTPSNKMKTVQSCDKYCEMQTCEPS